MRTLIGFLIALFAFLIAFGMAAGGGHGLGEMLAKAEFGAAAGLLHITEFIGLGGMLLGGMIIAFRPTDLLDTLAGCWPADTPPPDTDAGRERMRTRVLVCRTAAQLSIYFGIVETIAGIIIVMMYKLGQGGEHVGQGIATSMAGVLFGIFLAALFTVLKVKFLRQIIE